MRPPGRITASEGQSGIGGVVIRIGPVWASVAASMATLARSTLPTGSRLMVRVPGVGLTSASVQRPFASVTVEKAPKRTAAPSTGVPARPMARAVAFRERPVRAAP